MRTLLLAILGVTLGAMPASSQVPMQLVIPCYPLPVFQEAMEDQGYVLVQRGAFNDGDLFILYEGDGGKFIAGFISSTDQLMCTIGQGGGLEKTNAKPGRGS